MKKSTAVAVVKNYAIEKPGDMAAMADVLKSHIVKHGLFTEIAKKLYVHVEGWQFAGGLMGTFPRIVQVKELGPNRWMAEAEIVQLKTGNVISRGFAICDKKESKKASFDEYAVLSMAQTRAIGKAYRNVISWVVKLAGYEGTPAEEMTGAGQRPSKDGAFEIAQKFISTATSLEILKKAEDRVKNNKSINADQRETLLLMIHDRRQEIDPS